MTRHAQFPLLARGLCRLACGLLLGLALAASAQETAPAEVVALSTQQWLDAALASAEGQATKLRMEVILGQLDTRLRLAPCARIEPYLPTNGRLWGKSRVGLRCVEGATHWNVFLPVTVKAWGPAWVLRGAVSPGSTFKAEDAVAAEVDWASEASPILADPAQWQGQVAAYQLVAGQPLRQAMVRQAQAFQAGAAVRIVAQGPGFSVSSDGQALSTGVVGQLARVRTDSGRVISALVLDARTVAMSL
jgi:flagella basal body P-ring formation protein FlgA